MCESCKEIKELVDWWHVIKMPVPSHITIKDFGFNAVRGLEDSWTVGLKLPDYRYDCKFITEEKRWRAFRFPDADRAAYKALLRFVRRFGKKIAPQEWRIRLQLLRAACKILHQSPKKLSDLTALARTQQEFLVVARLEH